MDLGLEAALPLCSLQAVGLSYLVFWLRTHILYPPVSELLCPAGVWTLCSEPIASRLLCRAHALTARALHSEEQCCLYSGGYRIRPACTLYCREDVEKT